MATEWGADGAGDFNVADVHEAIAARQPDRECIVFGERRLSWGDVDERTRRLASFLHDRGLGCHTERAALAPWQSGQDHLAIYLHNGNEYLESLLGAFKARVAPFNVNYRYQAGELRELLDDASARAAVYHSAFAPTLSAAIANRSGLDVLVQVPDGSGQPLLPGATWYEDALAAGHPAGPNVARSPDDLYILYTGGTTGLPKGVLWRQGDAFTECFGGARVGAVGTVDDVVAAATSRVSAVVAPPFMHGAGQWMSFLTWHTGGCVLVPPRPERFDPEDVLGLGERERASFLMIVGDAFARPLIGELDRRSYDLSCLTTVMSGGASLSVASKTALLERLPHVLIVDGIGASEAGGQGRLVSGGGSTPRSGHFLLTRGSVVLSADLTGVLPGDDHSLGWLAKTGRLPLGYLGHAGKTSVTFPEVDGRRYAVAGDRARMGADGHVELQGRDSVTINSGGEKIFAEEVEAALMACPDVADCVVAGRPEDRWGNEVVAVVALRAGATTDAAELLEWAERSLARYKRPRAIVFVPEVVRSPSGKPDYRWAAAVARSAPASASIPSPGR